MTDRGGDGVVMWVGGISPPRATKDFRLHGHWAAVWVGRPPVHFVLIQIGEESKNNSKLSGYSIGVGSPARCANKSDRTSGRISKRNAVCIMIFV